MPIHSGAAGCDIEPYGVDVDVRKCLAYAAGLGETADVYFDDARPGGIVAPSRSPSSNSSSARIRWPAMSMVSPSMMRGLPVMSA
jgi:hypothetical protein